MGDCLTTKGESMNLPTHLPTLSNGKQEPGSNQVCAEQAVSWLVSGRLNLADETDHPSCVQPVLNHLAILVNDSLSDARRHEMWPIILRQPGTAHPETEPVLSVRLAAFLAERVLHLARVQDRPVLREALDATWTWCDDPSKENANNAANAAAAATYAAYAATYAAKAAYAAAAYAAAYAANAAAYAANAAAYAANAAAYAAKAAAYANANEKDDALLDMLRAAQDECERLTGHVPAACDIERLERLGELVGRG
jgi:hypothetical protein